MGTLIIGTCWPMWPDLQSEVLINRNITDINGELEDAKQIIQGLHNFIVRRNISTVLDFTNLDLYLRNFDYSGLLLIVKTVSLTTEHA